MNNRENLVSADVTFSRKTASRVESVESYGEDGKITVREYKESSEEESNIELHSDTDHVDEETKDGLRLWTWVMSGIRVAIFWKDWGG